MQTFEGKAPPDRSPVPSGQLSLRKKAAALCSATARRHADGCSGIHDVVLRHSSNGAASRCAYPRRRRSRGPFAGSRHHCRHVAFEIQNEDICVGSDGGVQRPMLTRG